MLNTLRKFQLLKVQSFIAKDRLLSNIVPQLASGSTICEDEINKFSNDAHEFWGEKYKLLYAMNSIRVPFIRDGILSINEVKSINAKPLDGYKILDVGCGSGLLSEPLARLGASVTGIDPSIRNIEVATDHALADDEIELKPNYICDTAENIAVSMQGSFDAVVCSEVVEHTANVPLIVKSCIELAKEGGSLFFTTINRTALSYINAIFVAEYLLGIVQKGTHEWNKFVKPEELSKILEGKGCRVVSVEGNFYNVFTQRWFWCYSTSVGYALHAVK